MVNPCRLYQRYAGENPRHERLHRDYATAYKRIMGMPGRDERGEYQQTESRAVVKNISGGVE